MAARRGPRPTGAARGKAVPPPLVEPLLRRPHLERLLDGALRRRLVTIVADAGFGKSTLLATWAAGNPAAWYTVTAADAEVGVLAAGLVDAISLRVPALATAVSGLIAAGRGPDADADESSRAGAHAALIAEALEQHLARDLVLVVDDLSEIAPTYPAGRFVEALIRMAPPLLHVVIASRAPPPFPIERLRGQGQVLGIDGASLAFSAAETEALLQHVLGADGAGAAGLLHEVTGGWPAAVRLAAEALRPVPPEERITTLAGVVRPGGAVYGYLAEEALARSDPSVRRLLDLVAPLDRFTPELCEALGAPGASTLVPAIAGRGLFLRTTDDGSWYQLTPLLREFLAGRRETGEGRAVLRRAASWHIRHGEASEALRCLTMAQDRRLASFLERHGSALLAAGDVDPVLSAVETVGDAGRSPAIDRLEGEARQVRGDWDGALRCFARLADPSGPMPSGVAWRMGLIQHLRGELDAAVATYARGTSDGGDSPDDALLHAWWASALWLRGEVAGCRALASRALREAVAADDDSALAAANTVMAMIAALDSDRRANDAHYLRALDHAERANDVLQAIRIRANRGSRFTEEGYYEEALTELDHAIRLADLAGFAAFRALALSNRGEVLMRLGRLDEAITELESARTLYQRLDSRLVSYPLGHLGEVYRQRGDMAIARAHFEEAIAIAEKTGDLQGLVPALSGLARVIVREEPERATELAARAAAAGPVLGRAAALLAVGWVALAAGDLRGARHATQEAESLARQRRDRAGLAEAIELGVRAAADATSELDRLDESLALWRDIGNPIGVARTELALAELMPAEAARPMAERALEQLRTLGARRLAGNAEHLLERLDEQRPASLEIRSLGGFEVLRDRRPVPLAEWRSRKARDVLKLLVANRGRRVARDLLLETFWPDEDPRRSAPRLSVVLSTIRSVLDPAKGRPADHYLGVDRASAWLRLDHLVVDVERFIAAAERGLRMLADGESAARGILAEAEAAFHGEFLGEDPYEDWAVATREEATGVYKRIAAGLAELALAAGERGAAIGFLLRMLERDPWDESASLRLVSVLAAAGRHGEARRAYRRYVGRMEELGLEAAAFPEEAP